MIDNHKTQGEWKIHVTTGINFISSKDSDKTHIIHTKSYNMEIMIGNETDKIIEEFLNTPLQRYQKDLEEWMRGSNFFFGNADLLYYKFHKIRFIRGGSYPDTPKLSLLLISIEKKEKVGKKKSFHHIKKTGKSLN